MGTKTLHSAHLLLVLAISLATGGCWAAAAQEPEPVEMFTGEINELSVVVDEAALGMPIGKLVDDLASARSFDLSKRFGFPIYARRLWARGDRITAPQGGEKKAEESDVLASALRDGIRLTVLLGYESDAQLSQAVMTILHAGISQDIQLNRISNFSTTDPLVFANGDPSTYQKAHYLSNTLSTGNTVGQWARVKGNAYVGVLDNGLFTAGGISEDLVHEDLRANYRPHLSSNFGFAVNGFQGGVNSVSNLDEYPHLRAPFAGHGTHVAGIVAATNLNGIGGSGVCPRCSIMAGRVTYLLEESDEDGPYWTPYVYWPSVGVGINELVSRGAQVVNMSFGHGGQTCSTYPAICDQLSFAVARDVVVVAATGNANDDMVDFPANDPRTIAVGATTTAGARWNDSSVDGTNYSTSPRIQPFVTAGKDIVSTIYPGATWNATCADQLPPAVGVGYGLCTGTSMAAPYVSGLVGLIRSIDPLRSREDVRTVLAATSNRTSCTHEACGNGVPDTALVVSAVNRPGIPGDSRL